jgi:hypothetical protein
LNAQQHGTDRIYFIGNFLRANQVSCQRLSYAIDYWSGSRCEARFLEHEGYFGALGAFLMSAKDPATTPSSAAASSSSSSPTFPAKAAGNLATTTSSAASVAPTRFGFEAATETARADWGTAGEAGSPPASPVTATSSKADSPNPAAPDVAAGAAAVGASAGDFLPPVLRVEGRDSGCELKKEGPEGAALVF